MRTTGFFYESEVEKIQIKHNDLLAISRGSCTLTMRNSSFRIPKTLFSKTNTMPLWVDGHTAKKVKGKTLFYNLKSKNNKLYGVVFKNEEFFSKFLERESQNKKLDEILMGESQIQGHGRLLIPEPYRNQINPNTANSDYILFKGLGNHFQIHRITQTMQKKSKKALER